ncbi:MAG: hypothetical protein CFE24_07040 [Flavobacterium sp. BFFFF2]|nr:MAG: hypothetical protein CFE24_07040 [Flavobacterium sp. BFFFF2]
MKKSLVIIVYFLLVCCGTKHAQILGYFTKTTNILYLYVQNRIEITSTSNATITAAIDNGIIKQIDNSTFEVQVQKDTTTTLTIYQDGKHRNFQFRVKQFPEPVISFDFGKCKNKTHFTTEEFKKLSTIDPLWLDFIYEGGSNFKEMEVIIIKRNNTRYFYHFNGNRFASATRSIESGDMILFRNMIVTFKGSFEKDIKVKDCLITIE